jgi:hypothetical protein
MISQRTRSLPALPIFLLTLLSLLVAAPMTVRADEFVMPFGGYLSIQPVGGEAGGVSTFGLGTSPSDFHAYFTGLPNTPSTTDAVNVGFFAAGTVIHMGMFTTFSGSSWAFSNGTDQASIVAFSDTDNSRICSRIVRATSVAVGKPILFSVTSR